MISAREDSLLLLTTRNFLAIEGHVTCPGRENADVNDVDINDLS